MTIGTILNRSILAAGFGAALLASPFVASQPTMAAGSVSITGGWPGAGYVGLKAGKRENFRCKVKYGRIAGQNFSVKALCASGSALVDQVGVLQRVANNRYVGDVHNQQFNISARVIVSVTGQSQTVKISSSEGSATLRLKRR